MRERLILFLLLATTVLCMVMPIPPSALGSDNSQVDAEIEQIIKLIDMANVTRHIEYLAEMGSRVTGYPGCDRAADYIYNKFEEYGLSNVHYERYNVTVPFDHGASVNVLTPVRRNIDAYTVWPNSVQTSPTPPDGITGQLTYVAQGELSDLNGKNLKGNIVLMDFNSQDHWIYAAKLGAKAAIFIEPVDVMPREADLKSLDIPIYFPRLYISRSDAEYLLSLLRDQEVRVTINSDMQYEVREARNVIGFVSGVDPDLEKQIMVVLSCYDSASVVPSLSPGANEACGIATLLEFARIISINRPRRTVMLVALSGHNQFLAGARDFTEDYFFGEHWRDVGANTVGIFGIDLTTVNDAVGAVCVGQGYHFPLSAGCDWEMYVSVKLKEWLPSIVNAWKKLHGKSYVVDVESNFILGYWGAQLRGSGPFKAEPLPFYLDTEPMHVMGGPGVTYKTLYAWDLQSGTPLDDLSRMNLRNLIPQVEFTISTLCKFMNLSQLYYDWDVVRPGGAPVRSGTIMDRQYSFFPLIGKVMEYDFKSGWYAPVPNAIVHIHPPPVRHWPEYFAMKYYQLFYKSDIIVKTDEKGKFRVNGMAYMGWGGPYQVDVYKVNSTGAILYGPDLGQFGAGAWPATISKGETFGTEDHPRQFVAFKCGSMVLYDLFDPRIIAESYIGYYNIKVTINDFRSHRSPVSFGQVTDGRHAIAFCPPDTPVEATVTEMGKGKYPYGLFLNASESHPEGVGFTLAFGEQLHLNMPYQTANDLYWLTHSRISQMERYNIQSLRAVEPHEEAGLHLRAAREAMDSLQYDKAMYEAYSCWALETGSYVETSLLVNDVLNMSIFFLAIIPIFAFIFERFILPQRSTNKRLLIIVALYFIFSLIFYTLHPGPMLATSGTTMIVMIVVLLLSILLLGILSSSFNTVLREIRHKIIGPHFSEKSSGETVLMAFSVAVSNMRRRSFRSILSLITMVLLVFSMITFTSMSTSTFVHIEKTPRLTLYDGIYIKQMRWESLSEETVNYVKAFFGNEAVVSPRAYLYPRESSLGITIWGPVGSYTIEALGGYTPEEALITHIDDSLTKGRWFIEESYFECIIPQEAAESLGADINANISVGGLQLKVVGIFDSDILNNVVIDLDKYPVTPCRLKAAEREVAGVLSKALGDFCVMVPYKLVLDIYGEIKNVAVGSFENSTRILTYAEQLAPKLRYLTIFAAVDGGVYEFWGAPGIEVKAWQFILVPFIIAILIMFNTMLGSVYERVKEIGILSSLGLSPRHVAFMFSAEAIVYGVLSVVSGYLMGLFGSGIMYSFQLLPSDFRPNFSSSFTLLTLIACMTAVLASSYYPLSKAGKLVTPSVERKWKIPTKPRVDEWRIPLPLKLASEQESFGFLTFMKEYLEPFIGVEVGAFTVIGEIKHGETEVKGAKYRFISFKVSLAPFDQGISQNMILRACLPTDETHWSLEVEIHRLTGELKMWETANRSFLNELRKQMLIWTSLPASVQGKYIPGFAAQNLGDM